MYSLGERLKQLRRDAGLSQEALGAQGFVSAPGWIKLENGQRSPSENLITALVSWLVVDKHIHSTAAKALREELLLRKYLGATSKFVRDMAGAMARQTEWGKQILRDMQGPAPSKRKRGRPKTAALVTR